jgi:hypothetical protein
VSDKPDKDFRDWLSAEAEGRDEEADALFGALFAGRVERLGPPDGFAARVVAAAGMAPAAPLMGWGWRVAALALVVPGGLAVAAFCATWLPDIVLAGWRFAPRLLAAAAAFYAEATEAVVWCAVLSVSVARALAFAASSGPGAALLTANLLVALAASAALRRVLSLEEEPS